LKETSQLLKLANRNGQDSTALDETGFAFNNKRNQGENLSQ
jgi:hypothetical protein